MEKETLILVVDVEFFEFDDLTKAFSEKTVTRQQISDTLYLLTSYDKPNEIFSSYYAQLLTLDEFIDKLNSDTINIDNSWVMKLEVV